jgi:hypothetical protein
MGANVGYEPVNKMSEFAEMDQAKEMLGMQ